MEKKKNANLIKFSIIRILNTISETAAGIYSMVFTVEVIAVGIIGAIGSGIKFGRIKF